MYFSIIIPSYNPNKYLDRLLTSITHNACKNEIEVIIADDLSTEDFSDILSRYNLYISVAKNDKHYGAPMYGRQNGANISTGKWICFADQDDWFADNTFDEVKYYIENNNLKNYIVTDFISIDDLGNEELKENTGNWTHGKFYEKDFWLKYNIAYRNTNYCEDIGLSVDIACILAENKLDRNYFKFITYYWYQHDDSLSNASKYVEDGYFFKSFPDYIRITLGTYIDKYEKSDTDQEIQFFYNFNIISMLMHLYFYFQGMKMLYNIPDNYYEIIDGYLNKFLEINGCTIDDIIDGIINSPKLMEEYNKVRSICYSQITFLESESFRDWLYSISKKGK